MPSHHGAGKGPGGSGSKAPTQRQLRVGEVLRQAISEVLLRGDVHNPLVESTSITVSEVRVSPDLKNATAYVAPLGGIAEGDVAEALNASADELRHLLTKKVYLKRVPRLYFKHDKSFDVADRVYSILRQPRVHKDVEDVDANAPVPEPAE